jgi:hypothetical protein
MAFGRRLARTRSNPLCSNNGCGHLVESPTPEQSAGSLFVFATPLLEEERDISSPAQRFDLVDPFRSHWPGVRPALAADDHPMDSGQVGPGDGSNQRFERNETDRGRHPAQRVDPIQHAVIFHAGAEPHIGWSGRFRAIPDMRSGRLVRT